MEYSSTTPSLSKYFLTTLAAIVILFTSMAASGSIPLTGQPLDTATDEAEDDMPTLASFIDSVSTGEESTTLAGVYAPEKFAFPVVQQPTDNPGYVSTQTGVITQFGIASNYNSIGLLAHNYLAGQSFFDLKVGDYVDLVFEDGSIQYYWIYEVRKYQALSPTDPYSNFVDLNDTTRVLSSTDLFLETYGKGVLVLQTCIQQDNEPSWGRMFVLAVPVTVSQTQTSLTMPTSVLATMN